MRWLARHYLARPGLTSARARDKKTNGRFYICPPMPQKHNPVIVALDFDDLDKALMLIEKVRSSVGLFKVGLELFSQYGPACVTEVKARGVDVFLDLKLHDIPNTVGSARRACARLGSSSSPSIRTGGVAMMKAAVRARPTNTPPRDTPNPAYWLAYLPA